MNPTSVALLNSDGVPGFYTQNAIYWHKKRFFHGPYPQHVEPCKVPLSDLRWFFNLDLANQMRNRTYCHKTVHSASKALNTFQKNIQIKRDELRLIIFSESSAALKAFLFHLTFNKSSVVFLIAEEGFCIFRHII